jgi:DNA-binding NtrC family response regulator
VNRERANAPQILLVDDNATNLQVLYQTLEGHGYRLLAARSGTDALSIAQRALPDLILLDVMMPDMDGFETCRRLKADPRTRDTAVIFLSALNEARERARGLALGAVDFVNKPFQAEEVLARVRTHLTIRELQTQLTRRNAELEHELTVAQELLREARDRSDGILLGDSEVAARLRRDIRDAAASDDVLLISGPPGSDHEAVARAVHHQSPRATRAIICTNCLSMSAEAGASADDLTTTDFVDKIRLANGGTLYLEGIQHLPESAQRTLAERIRSLEAGRMSGTPETGIRVIVATTRDVDQELAAGRLIPELHRVLQRTIDLAPLRARIEDLRALAPHILRRQAEQAGRTVPVITEDTLNRLRSYRWPGNLRELRNVLGAALAASSGPVLEIGDHLLDNAVRVGSYRLLERLGAGGMGEVWLARHQLLARPAAVKIVRESALGLADDTQAQRQRFTREAQTTAELESPHTVRLFDFGITESGSCYYVMERLRGMDLQRMVERHGPLLPERTIFLLRQACLSLSEAHARKLVHRDIKPANLFVCRLGSQYDFLKVLDFGVVSRQGRGRPSTSITVAGVVLGTPAFLAPELVSGDLGFDGRADLYALGCVAFWLLTARTPFEASDAVTLMQLHSSAPPPPPSALSELPIPKELDQVVLACLAKDPRHRPASADALAHTLDQLAAAYPWQQRQAQSWWELHEPELSEHR